MNKEHIEILLKRLRSDYVTLDNQEIFDIVHVALSKEQLQMFIVLLEILNDHYYSIKYFITDKGEIN